MVILNELIPKKIVDKPINKGIKGSTKLNGTPASVREYPNKKYLPNCALGTPKILPYFVSTMDVH